MGKYMKKSKGTGGVALMEMSHSHTQPSLGVRTRAKTLALQRLQSSSSSALAAVKEGEGGGGGVGGSYLQLRSRRLEKVSPILVGKRQKLSQMHMNLQQKNPSSRYRLKGTEEKNEARDQEEEKVKECLSDEKIEGLIKEDKESRGGDFGVEETSFGENVLEFGVRGRSSRESTPCSLIRGDADAIRTPGSSTRPSTRSITRNRDHLIPPTDEMEAFFSGSEELQQRKFVDKYNFDPVTDRPLPGHFEWEKLNR